MMEGSSKSVLTARQQRALLDYWKVYDSHYDHIQAETMRFALAHPEFGPLIRAVPEAQLAEQNRASRERLRRAMEEGAWDEYERDLRTQGAVYALGGLSFAGWYDLIRAFQQSLVPLLVDAYGAEPERLKAAILESQRFLDHAMVTIGEEYLAAKERARAASAAEAAHAQDASRAKSDFLAMMSHELRTPLNAIIGFSEILIDGRFGLLNDRQGRYLRNVHESGRHLLGLINDLLDLSKIEAGKLEVARQSCAPRRFAEEAIAVLQPLADARKVRLLVEAGAAVPAVAADATRFKQVLYNLLSNAVKFTPEGGTVTVGAERSGDGWFVRTFVRDTGPGIAAADIQRLFTPFMQLANAKEAPRTGTGLGLALTRQLVELMGGKVGVESAPGTGSTFFVDLPVAAAATAAPNDAPHAAKDAPLALVIDDDPASRELLDLALQGGGYRTTFAATGEEGITQARERHPAVMTLDVFLPTIDGWDVLRVLKSDPLTSEIPVVMVTISSDRRKAFSLGAVEHLVKPIDRQELLAVLARRDFTTRAAAGPVHVLVIDDDLQQLELISAELEPRGFRVKTAQNGRDGIAAALAGQVDLLLLDLVMPDLSGVEVVEALKRHERTRGIPILLITAATLTPEDHRRLNGAVEAVLAKGTFQVDALLAEIGRVTRKRR